MAKSNAKNLLKRQKEIENRISKLYTEIDILNREHREITNYLDLNKNKPKEDSYE